MDFRCMKVEGYLSKAILWDPLVAHSSDVIGGGHSVERLAGHKVNISDVLYYSIW